MKTKRTLSLLLSLVMVFTMVPAASLTFAPKAQAAAFPTYTKNYDTEYYYPNGTQFIYQVATSSNPTASTAKTLLTGAGFTLLDIEFNKSVEGNYVYLGYTTTTDPLQACRALVVWDLTESADGFNYYVDKPFNGADRTFYMVGAGFDEHTPQAASGIVNLNDGCAAGSHEQFLFVTADRGAGLPITGLQMAYGTGGSVWQNLTGAGYTVVHSFQSGDPEDLNEGT